MAGMDHLSKTLKLMGIPPLWLIMGHGSVGSALSKRITGIGHRVIVYDPAPRIPVTYGRRVQELSAEDGAVQYVVSCVPPEIADSIPMLVAALVERPSVLMDWNTVSPEVKRGIATATPCEVIDVALLDTLDSACARPRLAISGPTAANHRTLLDKLGFHVDIAGDRCGDAALVKLTRSVFMKSLEALALEYAVLIRGMDPHGIVDASVARNLGEQCMQFMRVLVATNRLHSSRRAAELAQAVEVIGQRGVPVDMARAAMLFLQQVAGLWDEPDAPAEGAGTEALIDYLARNLGR